jgi:hypothetical protein
VADTPASGDSTSVVGRCAAALPESRQESMMKTTYFSLLAAALLALPFAAHAADVGEAAKEGAEARYDAAKERAEIDYKTAKERCATLKGDAEDVCEKDAEAAYDKAKADADAARKSAKASAEAMDERLTADYKAEKARCDTLSGNAKDECVAAAKLKYHQ